ncbi:MAG: peptidoglycan editing factor PgeF [Acidobacteria bacterium]|nr:peptidoglycan editing factor PgeF [Acidobacteriota bacterium]
MPTNFRSAPKNHLPSSTLVLRAPALAEIPWLVHGFSTRLGGVSAIPDSKTSRAELNLGTVNWDSPANVAENRRRFLDCLRAERMHTFLQEQIHSDLIRAVDETPAHSRRLRGDGMITSRAGLLLAILAADCLPVLVVDVRQRVVAALHCGWRGTVHRIAQKGVGRMRQLYGSRPADLRAAIGPGIRACCYRVGEEVAAEFECQFLYSASLLVIQKPQKKFVDKKYALMQSERWRGTPSHDGRMIHLDLVEANVRQLQEAGVDRSQIYSDAPCTSCHPELFFSHRRDAGRTGRMMGVIGIRR